MSEKTTNKHDTRRIKIFFPAILLSLIGFIVAYQFVDPAPPKRIVMGTASQRGAYYGFGQAYSKLLARENITLEVLSTAGSVENIHLLEVSSGGVDIAFIQGGVGDSSISDDLMSLGSLYFEPIWVFYQAKMPLRQLSDLRDKRIAIGMEGSGTRAVALKLLELNGITTSQTTHLSIGGQEAAEGLVKRELDAAFFVASPSASFIKMLLKEKGMEVMSFERAEAYTRVFHFLSRVKLPEGVVDFQKNIPSRDVFLLAATANLVTRRDFHPALIDLLLQTADEIHGSGGLLEKPGEFPSPKYLEFQLSKDARRYYKSGPPFLQRYLPFWAATLIDRLKVMLLPVVALLFPLFRIMPPIYRWRVRSRIYRWYSELQDVDPKLKEKELVKQIDQSLTELNRIEEEVAKVSIPLSYAEELYELRLHIEMVREKLLELKNKRKI